MATRGRDQFAKLKPIINLLVKFINFLPLKMRLWLFEKKRFVTGKKGIAIRYILLKTIAKECGDNVAIFPNVYLLNPQNLSIGSNVSIQPMCYIECGNKAGIEIGNDVAIAHSVSMIATNHGFDNLELTIKDHPVVEGKIIIGNDVWLGAKVTVVAGNTIGSRCIVAANAVVTKDVSDFTLVGGVPAKKIKDLNGDV